jgi:hypothetical protein
LRKEPAYFSLRIVQFSLRSRKRIENFGFGITDTEIKIKELFSTDAREDKNLF